MAKSPATSRALKSIVSPALGLSLSVLTAAGAAATGCDNSPAGSGAAADGTEKIPPPGAVSPERFDAGQPTPPVTASGPTAVGTFAPPARPVPRPGRVAAPGLAPSGASLAAVEGRPTRATRRSTDPDRHALRLGLPAGARGLV